MFNWYKKQVQKYKAPEDISNIIHKQNRFHIKFVYGFSTLFGIVTLLLFLLLNHSEVVNTQRVLYYMYYIIVGIIGLALSFTKSGKLTPSIAMFVFFGISYTYYFFNHPLHIALLYYLGFMFFLIILFEFNPFVMAYSIISYHVVLVVLIFILPDHPIKISPKLWTNIVFVNICIIYLSFWKRRSLLKKFEVEKNTQEEKKKSENLLLNILPQKVMEQLRDTGKSNPEYFDNTTVLFAEIVNFEDLNSKLDTETLINKINEIYEAFDSIVEKNHGVRIKTTGAIYMAVSGLPVPDEKHAENMIFCGKQIISFVEKYNQNSDIQISVRIGLNSGKVIAGIVGIKKYIYDIFGDTVNTASRMETLSQPMQVNISENTYLLVKDKFNFKKQDALQVKGKGTMQTYYLDD